MGEHAEVERMMDDWRNGDRRVPGPRPRPSRPEVVCLCGSTRFKDVFLAENKRLTLAGKIVLSVGFFAHADDTPPTAQEKIALDELHFRKIDLADSIFVLNVGGYIGYSTAREIAYALGTGKGVVFLEPEVGDQWYLHHSSSLGRLVADLTAPGRGEAV